MHRNQTSWFKAALGRLRRARGLNPHFTIVDEIHAFDENGRRLFETLRYARHRTAPSRRYHSDINRQGRRDVHWLSAIRVREVGPDRHRRRPMVVRGHRRASPDDDFTDPAVWRKANPSLGTILRKEMAEEAAKRSRTRLQSSFKQHLRLNIWVRTSDPWLDMIAWKKCGVAIDANSLLGQTCCGGLDLSTVKDLSASFLPSAPDPPEEDSGYTGPVIVTRAEDLVDEQDANLSDSIYTLLPFFFLPEDGIRERDIRIGSRTGWQSDAGYITLTPGNTIDYGFIEHTVVKGGDPGTRSTRCLRPVQRDRPYQAARREARAHHGRDPPGLSLDVDEQFERLVLSGQLRHADNPVLGWMASHVSVATGRPGTSSP